MDVAVVYESAFGNTRAVAEAIAAGASSAGPQARVAVMSVTEAGSLTAGEAALLIVGGPTHLMRMSTEGTRHLGTEPDGPPAADGPGQPVPAGAGRGVREWLACLPPARPGARAAAFDTRQGYPLSGGAARSIARHLRRHGYHLTARPEGFVVEGPRGPLRGGERDRARRWGAALATQFAARTTGR